MFNNLRALILVFTAFATALCSPFIANAAMQIPDTTVLPEAVGPSVIRSLKVPQQELNSPGELDPAFPPNTSLQFRDILDPNTKRCAWKTYEALKEGLRRYQMPGPLPHELQFDLVVHPATGTPGERPAIVDNRALMEFSRGRHEGGISVFAQWSMPDGILKCDAPKPSDIGAFLSSLGMASRDARAHNRGQRLRAPAGISQTPVIAVPSAGEGSQ